MQKLFSPFERLWVKSSKYLLALVLLCVPLYPKFPLFDVPYVSVALRLEDLIVFVVFVVWFLGNVRNYRVICKDPIRRAIFLFWAIGLLSTLSAIFLTSTVIPLVGLLHWARRVQYMLFFVMALDTKTTKNELHFYLKCLVVVVLYVFIDGLGQRYFNWPIITTQNAEYSKGLALQFVSGGHLVSTFAGHYDLASFLILITPIFVVFALYRKIKIQFAVALVFSSLLGVWLIANAASRISIVSYAGSISLALILARRIKFIPIVLFIIFVFSASSMSLIGRYENILDVIVKKVHAAEIAAPIIESTPEPTPVPVLEDRSTNIRLDVEWPRALRALNKNPLLGTGYSSITLATDNDYLRSLGEVGILGSLSFLLCMVIIFKEIFGAYIHRRGWNSDRLLAAGVLGAVPGILLNMVFIDILEASKIAIILWLILGITISHLRTTKS